MCEAAFSFPAAAILYHGKQHKLCYIKLDLLNILKQENHINTLANKNLKD